MGERRLAADQVQRYDRYKVLVPQIRTLIGAIPLLRHCVDEVHKYQELRSRLKRLTSLVAAAVEQQSDLLRYARDIFQDLFRKICIICLICGDQPATRVGGPAFNG